MLSGMPYALADDWFAEKLNSVSSSYQRQKMRRSRESRKGGAGTSGTPSNTRSTSRRTDSRKQQQVEAGTAKKSAPVKKHDVSRAAPASSTASGAASSTTPRVQSDATETIDIAELLCDVLRRIRQHHAPENVAKTMPVGHPMWTPTNILEHAAALSVKLRDTHWLACGLDHPDATKSDASDDDDVQYMGEEGGDVDEGAGGDGDIEMKTEDAQEEAAAAPATPVVTPASDVVLQDTSDTCVRVYMHDG